MKVLSILKRIPNSVKIAIFLVVATKILVLSLGYAVNYLNNGPAPALTIVMNMFNRWDAPHYIDIARNWYVNTGDAANFIVFFPLYPILIRLVTVNLGYFDLSALAVANVCSIVAFLYLYKLAKLEFDDGVALKAVVFLSIFPTAYFLSAPYTEGLFFALVIAGMYYARLAKWPLAGFLCFFAALTRLSGLLMLPVLLVEYLHQKDWKPRKSDFNILWVFLALAGFLIYLGINNQVTGDPFAFMKVQATHWYNTLDPVAGLTQAFGWAIGGAYPQNLTLGIAPLAFAVLGLLATAFGVWQRLRPSYIVYMFLTWALAVSTSFWISVPRYVMAIFPMFMLFGLLTKRKAVNFAIALVSLAALCYFTVFFALGWWAF